MDLCACSWGDGGGSTLTLPDAGAGQRAGGNWQLATTARAGVPRTQIIGPTHLNEVASIILRHDQTLTAVAGRPRSLMDGSCAGRAAVVRPVAGCASPFDRQPLCSPLRRYAPVRQLTANPTPESSRENSSRKASPFRRGRRRRHRHVLRPGQRREGGPRGLLRGPRGRRAPAAGVPARGAARGGAAVRAEVRGALAAARGGGGRRPRRGGGDAAAAARRTARLALPLLPPCAPA